MTAAEHEQLGDADPWHLGSVATFGQHEITLMALVDATGLVDAGILDGQANYMGVADLRRYIATLQGMLARIDALAGDSASG
jgi:hypothetical protein